MKREHELEVEVRVKVRALGGLGDCQGAGPARADRRVSATVRTAGQAHLVLLLEAVALGCLHLVDVLQEVSHAYCRVKLSCVVWGALPAAWAPRRTPQEAAGLGDAAASLVPCGKGKGALTQMHPQAGGP